MAVVKIPRDANCGRNQSGCLFVIPSGSRLSTLVRVRSFRVDGNSESMPRRQKQLRTGISFTYLYSEYLGFVVASRWLGRRSPVSQPLTVTLFPSGSRIMFYG
jgi:hypothetical protein